MATPTENTRHPDHPVDRMFVERWSPRSFTGEDMPVETMMTIFEAARWAPSSSNVQPWRIAWARRGTPDFERFLSLLGGANPSWCRDASVLAFVASAEFAPSPGKPEGVPSWTHSYDAGAAWMSIALQAHLLGWHTHGMIGIKIADVAEALGLPLGHRVEAAFAIGKQDDPAKLPDGLRAREKPSGRKPLAETCAEGRFPA